VAAAPPDALSMGWPTRFATRWPGHGAGACFDLGCHSVVEGPLASSDLTDLLRFALWNSRQWWAAGFASWKLLEAATASDWLEPAQRIATAMMPLKAAVAQVFRFVFGEARGGPRMPRSLFFPRSGGGWIRCRVWWRVCAGLGAAISALIG